MFTVSRLAVLWISLLLACCSRLSVGSGGQPLAVTGKPVHAVTGEPVYRVRPGVYPLWFELGPSGPVPIGDPVEAAQDPFTPWRLARHVAGMSLSGQTLTLAVNREGFLAVAPTQPGGDLAVYRAAEPRWGDYTVAALFLFQETPAALLYRDDFFLDSTAALPDPRVWRWTPGSPHPLGTEIPAFAELPAAAGWDIESLTRGNDGHWYYRAQRKNPSPPATAYFRAKTLEDPGETVSAGVFRTASLSYTEDTVPARFLNVLREAGREGGKTPLAVTVCSDSPGLRYYAGGQGDELLELAGFYADGAIALVLFPGGRILYDTGFGVSTASLPALPERFVYTRVCLVDGVIIAAWEEQDGWNVGAAGFMALSGLWAR